MKIAVVGAGVSGLVAARSLDERHQVTLYEAQPRLGGHAHTHEVVEGGETLALDTGFLVFNSWTYPRFEELLAALDVGAVDSSMSFSVRCERTGLEYNGTSIDGLFVQRRNLLRPGFLRMVVDILRFNRWARRWLAQGGDDRTLGELIEGRYSAAFRDRYLVPITAAIWSAQPGSVLDIPARFVLQFFDNHGMLSVDDRPVWRTVSGGSHRYVGRLAEQLRGEIRLGEPVTSVARRGGAIVVESEHRAESYDAVVLAVHSDQALRLLDRPGAAEREILGAIPYQRNEVVLHTDTSLMPDNRRAWAAWNYHLPAQSTPSGASSPATVTYWLNELQGLSVDTDYLVTLNHIQNIDPRRIITVMSYHHPIYTDEAVRAKARWGEISGVEGVHYCGAYWGYGFHEDGVVSGLAVADSFERAGRR